MNIFYLCIFYKKIKISIIFLLIFYKNILFAYSAEEKNINNDYSIEGKIVYPNKSFIKAKLKNIKIKKNYRYKPYSKVYTISKGENYFKNGKKKKNFNENLIHISKQINLNQFQRMILENQNKYTETNVRFNETQTEKNNFFPTLANNNNILLNENIINNTPFQENLNIIDNALLQENANIIRNVVFQENARITNNALFRENRSIINNNLFQENENIINNTSFQENVNVINNSLFRENANIMNNTLFQENVNIINNDIFQGNANIINNTLFHENVNIINNSLFQENANIINNFLFQENINKDTNINKNENIINDALFQENVNIINNALFHENVNIINNSLFHENANINKNTNINQDENVNKNTAINENRNNNDLFYQIQNMLNNDLFQETENINKKIISKENKKINEETTLRKKKSNNSSFQEIRNMCKEIMLSENINTNKNLMIENNNVIYAKYVLNELQNANETKIINNEIMKRMKALSDADVDTVKLSRLNLKNYEHILPNLYTKKKNKLHFHKKYELCVKYENKRRILFSNKNVHNSIKGFYWKKHEYVEGLYFLNQCDNLDKLLNCFEIFKIILFLMTLLYSKSVSTARYNFFEKLNSRYITFQKHLKNPNKISFFNTSIRNLKTLNFYLKNDYKYQSLLNITRYFSLNNIKQYSKYNDKLFICISTFNYLYKNIKKLTLRNKHYKMNSYCAIYFSSMLKCKRISKNIKRALVFIEKDIKKIKSFLLLKFKNSINFIVYLFYKLGALHLKLLIDFVPSDPEWNLYFCNFYLFLETFDLLAHKFKSPEMYKEMKSLCKIMFKNDTLLNIIILYYQFCVAKFYLLFINKKFNNIFNIIKHDTFRKNTKYIFINKDLTYKLNAYFKILKYNVIQAKSVFFKFLKNKIFHKIYKKILCIAEDIKMRNEKLMRLVSLRQKIKKEKKSVIKQIIFEDDDNNIQKNNKKETLADTIEDLIIKHNYRLCEEKYNECMQEIEKLYDEIFELRNDRSFH